MAVFKCKMCGGAMKIDGQAYGTCPYCGTQQTFPKLDDERRAQMYERANEFRRLNEFDKALGIYEQILSEEPTDAEAYWSVVLCTYGVEYVEDPRTHKRIPTVNRAQYTSIYADKNYLSALENADLMQKQIYEEEAKKIDEIQKGILEVSSKEEPYDVFICYKETNDTNGERTNDSVYAFDIYESLVKEGYRVFFSRVTLENKLGKAFEPYIFAALNSAKVMLVVGTNKDNFNAVWVKNEWSRYLSLMSTNKEKVLIPVYRDCTPTDLPDEFAYLQAQDMSKVGAMQDLVHGIKKIINNDIPIVQQVITSAASSNVDSLLERAFMFLEDSDWVYASEYCEKVLDIDPKCAEAYVGKLMSGMKISKRENIANSKDSLDNNSFYQKAIRFGSLDLKAELTDYNEIIKSRNEKSRLASSYTSAVNKMNSAKDENDYANAARIFESIREYEDSASLMEECKVKAEQARHERIQREEQERLEKERLDEEKRINDEKIRLKRNSIIKRVIIVAASIALLVLILFSVLKIISKSNVKDIQTAKEGDVISFGKYEWIVLKKNDDKALIITKDCVAKRKYNELEEREIEVAPDTYYTEKSYANITWEMCELRSWLNGPFLRDAFSLSERMLIEKTYVTNNNNFKYNTNAGNDTVDKVFILSLSEFDVYFTNISKNAKYNNEPAWWWLRSPGSKSNTASYVYKYGAVHSEGVYVDKENGGVRPAVWVSID